MCVVSDDTYSCMLRAAESFNSRVDDATWHNRYFISTFHMRLMQRLHEDATSAVIVVIHLSKIPRFLQCRYYCSFSVRYTVLILYCIIAMWFFQDVGLSAAFIIRLLVGHLDALNRRWWITSVEVLAISVCFILLFCMFYVLSCVFVCYVCGPSCLK